MSALIVEIHSILFHLTFSPYIISKKTLYAITLKHARVPGPLYLDFNAFKMTPASFDCDYFVLFIIQD